MGSEVLSADIAWRTRYRKFDIIVILYFWGRELKKKINYFIIILIILFNFFSYRLLLINVTFGKYVLSTNLSVNKKDSRSSGEVLKTFFYEAVSDLINKGNIQNLSFTFYIVFIVLFIAKSIYFISETNDIPLETYWCSEYHKLHALRSGDNVICLLYNHTVPTHTMRLVDP